MRGSAGRSAYSGVVERDDPPVRRQAVDQGRVPIVEIPSEVLKQDQRYRAAAGVAVGVVNAVGGTDQFVPKLRISSSHVVHLVKFV
jgi:hypothetical protein